MAADAAFARSIVNELASCYRDVVRNQKNLKLRTGVERLASYLAHQHSKQGASGVVKLQIDKKNACVNARDDTGKSFACIFDIEKKWHRR